MTNEQFNEEKENISQLLKNMSANCGKIENETVDQSESKNELSTEDIL